MTENRGRKPAAGKPGGPEKRTDQDETEARRQADAKPKDQVEAQRQADATPKAGKPNAGKPNDDAPAGEELTGEGSPGLTIMGGGGHA